MAEENQDLDVPVGNTEEVMGTPLSESGQVPEPAQARRQILTDETGVVSQYSNFTYTAGTREGVLFGFGLHDWQGKGTIRVDSKIEMSYYNSKRLLVGLNQLVKRHEDVFGALELDLNKRVVKKS